MNVQLKRITDSSDKLFKASWILYNQAFPFSERRSLEIQYEVMKLNTYHYIVVLVDGSFCGLVLWWQFNSCLYIEHLAIDEKKRGKGLGMHVLELLKENTEGQIILEVELPDSEINIRRIEFYQRAGFHLNEYKFRQFPLQPGADSIELLLMSYPLLINETEYLQFKDSIKNSCYSPFKHLISRHDSRKLVR